MRSTTAIKPLLYLDHSGPFLEIKSLLYRALQLYFISWIQWLFQIILQITPWILRPAHPKLGAKSGLRFVCNYKAQHHHVYLGNRRNTTSLDNSPAFFMALKLGQVPRTPEAKRVINQWLQARLDDHGDPGRTQVSQWLRFEVIQSEFTKSNSMVEARMRAVNSKP